MTKFYCEICQKEYARNAGVTNVAGEIKACDDCWLGAVKTAHAARDVKVKHPFDPRPANEIAALAREVLKQMRDLAARARPDGS